MTNRVPGTRLKRQAKPDKPAVVFDNEEAVELSPGESYTCQGGGGVAGEITGLFWYDHDTGDFSTELDHIFRELGFLTGPYDQPPVGGAVTGDWLAFAQLQGVIAGDVEWTVDFTDAGAGAYTDPIFVAIGPTLIVYAAVQDGTFYTEAYNAGTVTATATVDGVEYGPILLDLYNEYDGTPPP